MTNYTDIVHRALHAATAPISGAELYEQIDSITERHQISSALSHLVKTGRATVVSEEKRLGSSKPARLYQSLVAPKDALDSASAEDLRDMAEEAEARARAAELESQPAGPTSASAPLVPPPTGRITPPAPTVPPPRSGLRRHPALADIQREMDALRAHFDRAISLQPSIQRGAELAAALRAGIPQLEPLAPHYSAIITEAAAALEEFTA